MIVSSHSVRIISYPRHDLIILIILIIRCIAWLATSDDSTRSGRLLRNQACTQHP
jgi:hypothetical protein